MLQRRTVLRWAVGTLPGVVVAALGVLLLRPAAPPPVTPFAWHGWQPARPFLIVAGGAPDAPPYTLPAFRRAVAGGAQALEAPLRFTADGEPVVYPAGDLAATTDGQGPVARLTLAELKSLDAGYRFQGPSGDFPFRGHGLQVPLLEEVLAAFPGVPLLLDVVDPAPTPAHLNRLALIVRRWEVSAMILLSARSPEAAGDLRRLFPASPVVSTPAETASFLRLARLGLTRFARTPFHLLRVPARPLSEQQVAAAHRRHLAVLAGPVSSPDEVRRLIRLGVDGLILVGTAAGPLSQ